MRILRVAALGLLCHGVIAVLQAQTPPPLVESIEVRVVSLDVVVTDKSGKRITGLTQDDFEVFEKGRKQEITNFSEISASDETAAATAEAKPGEAQAQAQPERRKNTVVFFVDNSSIDPRRRHIVFDELRRFCDTALLPGDRAMVVTWNRNFRIAHPFTEKAADVQRTLAKLELESDGASLLASRRIVQQRIRDELEDTLEQGLPILGAYTNARMYARNYAEEMFAQVRAMLFSVGATMSVFGGTEDKKVFVFIGDYLPTKAGAEMEQFIDEIFTGYPDIRNQDSPQIDVITMSKLLNETIRLANASGVTLYMISGGSLEQTYVDSGDRQFPISPMSRVTERADTITAFAETSEQTGGVAFLGGTDPRKALQQIVDDFHAYYSIGFRPTSAADGKERTIKVRAKNPNYVIRSRKTYVLRSVADEMADRVTANFHQAVLPGELSVRVQPGKPELKSRNSVRVPVKVMVEGERVTLLPRGNELTGELTVFICAGGTEAEASRVIRHTQRVSIPAADEKRFRASHLTFSFEVLLRSNGEKLISAGALDNVSGSFGIARAPVHEGPRDLRPEPQPVRPVEVID